MSRFDQGRWNRVLVWTGAALTWGTALMAARFEPATGREDSVSQPSQIETIAAGRVMPNLPDQGLVVIRSGKDRANQTTAQSSQIVPSQTSQAPATSPEMVSSGS
jgi:hypothetical protein